MNDLQHIPEETAGPVLVTLNPPFEPRKELIQGRWAYEHPVLDSEVRLHKNSPPPFPCLLFIYLTNKTPLFNPNSIGGICPRGDAPNPEQTRDILRRGLSTVWVPRRRVHHRSSSRSASPGRQAPLRYRSSPSERLTSLACLPL